MCCSLSNQHSVEYLDRNLRPASGKLPLATTFRIRWLSQSLQDIRQACRSLLRSASFSVAAILTLALGSGANTAVFSVVNTVLLKPLNYPEPDRIVQFRLKSTEGSVPSASIPDLRFWL